MGLNLNSIYHRPYLVPDRRNKVNKKEDEERSASNAQKEEQSGQNTRSKGLQFTEQSRAAYQPSYQQLYQKSYQQVTTDQLSVPYPNEVATALAQRSSNINIAQILRDFKNTAIAIGTPDDLKEEVNGYLELIEKQITKQEPNSKLVKSNLKNAASILDSYISKTLDKSSKVVENWVDALFLQQIDFKYNEDDINPDFLVKFPEDKLNRTQQTEEVQETPVNPYIPQDAELKKMFIQAKKMTYANKPREAIEAFQAALERANEVDDKETQSKIFLEVGKIYDDYSYLTQALKSYHQSAQRTSDCNIKTRAHYSMAEIYNDVNQIEPAIDHYFSTVSFAGEAENLSVQSTSLAKIGNIYTDMYDKEAFDYFEAADSIADETDNSKVKGYVSSSLGDAYDKFGDYTEALKSYSKAVKNYIDADSPQRAAQNYLSAAEIMIEYNSGDKAKSLLEKAQKFARKTDDLNLMTEINNTLVSIS